MRTFVRTTMTALSFLLLPAAIDSYAGPINPGDYPSLLQNRFTVPGTYVIETSMPPTLTGPTGGVIGWNSPDLSVAVFVFDSITIVPGAVVVGHGPRPFALLSQSSFELMSGGRIDVSGRFEAGTFVGGPGGADGGAGAGGGPGGGGATSNSGGGAGFGAAGGTGGGAIGGFGGIAYGNLAILLQGGSSGGGTGGSPLGAIGGAGGGAVEIGASQSLIADGEILAEGTPGSAAPGGGGGGSGGGVMIHAPSVTLSGLVSVNGGAGGDGFSGGGGGGAAGRAVVFTNTGGLTTQPTFTFRGFGGFGGIPGGALGGSTGLLADVFPPPPRPIALSGCIDIAGNPLVGAQLKLRQKGGGHQETVTGSDGCYAFETAVSGRDGTLSIDLPAFP